MFSDLPQSQSQNLSSKVHCLPLKCLSSSSISTGCVDSSQLSSSQQGPRGRLLKSQALRQNRGLLALWLRSCSNAEDVQKVHTFIFKYLDDGDIYINNNLMSGYFRFGRWDEGQKVFEEMRERNVVSWTTMINACQMFRKEDEGLRLFLDFLCSGFHPNCTTYVCVLNLCSKIFNLELGRQFHASIIKSAQSNLIVDSAIVQLYAQCMEFKCASRAFDQMREHDVVSWTTMISACAHQGRENHSLLMFLEMLAAGLSPNEYTVCSILDICADLKTLNFGKQLHGIIVKKMVKHDVFVGTSLVDMYVKCGEVEDSRKVFNQMWKRNTVTWTSLISGYARQGLGDEAISLFREMKRRNIYANKMTIVSILLACGESRNLQLGREVHAQVVRNLMQSNMHIGSTLVWFYCRCGKDSIASNVLHRMPFRDVVSWTAMISGCANLRQEEDALELLKKMMEEGVEPNSFTYSSALKACARLEASSMGKLIHSSANKKAELSNVFVGSALVHMYAKCGDVSEAVQVFESMPERGLVTWRSMVLGYARNGHCQDALKLMYRMKAQGFQVDDFLLTTVLTACGDVQLDMEASSELLLQPS